MRLDAPRIAAFAIRYCGEYFARKARYGPFWGQVPGRVAKQTRIASASVLALAGRKAWYLPRWLDRILPDLDVEGASRREPRPTAPPALAELTGSGAGTTDRSVERSLWAHREPAGTGGYGARGPEKSEGAIWDLRSSGRPGMS